MHFYCPVFYVSYTIPCKCFNFHKSKPKLEIVNEDFTINMWVHNPVRLLEESHYELNKVYFSTDK